jgi:hypothetical protein
LERSTAAALGTDIFLLLKETSCAAAHAQANDRRKVKRDLIIVNIAKTFEMLAVLIV